MGTFHVLEACRRYEVRLHHVSTDEVYGDKKLGDAALFTADSPYRPSSPYTATKAGSDLLVRSWVRSFGVAAAISNCCNNYGSFQHAEMFIARTITNRIDGIRPRLYGDGRNVRDWIHVEDHDAALFAVIEHGRLGEIYLIGARCEKSNLEIARTLNRLMGLPEEDFDLVADRPGHDRRYGVDPTKLMEETGWTPRHTDFEAGLAQTIEWYRAHEDWWRPAKSGTEAQYAAHGQ